jgi:hypothetical protein
MELLLPGMILLGVVFFVMIPGTAYLSICFPHLHCSSAFRLSYLGELLLLNCMRRLLCYLELIFRSLACK